jgi:hypothetical protein
VPTCSSRTAVFFAGDLSPLNTGLRTAVAMTGSPHITPHASTPRPVDDRQASPLVVTPDARRSRVRFERQATQFVDDRQFRFCPRISRSSKRLSRWVFGMAAIYWDLLVPLIQRWSSLTQCVCQFFHGALAATTCQTWILLKILK